MSDNRMRELLTDMDELLDSLEGMNTTAAAIGRALKSVQELRASDLLSIQDAAILAGGLGAIAFLLGWRDEERKKG